MRRLVLAVAVMLLASLASCTTPRPPNRAPDLAGTVVGRTPRLPKRDGAAHLVIAAPSTHVDVALGPDVRVLEARSDGSYRAAESDESWIGRTVQVWFSADAVDTAQPPSAPLPAGVIARRASFVVVTPRP